MQPRLASLLANILLTCGVLACVVGIIRNGRLLVSLRHQDKMIEGLMQAPQDIDVRPLARRFDPRVNYDGGPQPVWCLLFVGDDASAARTEDVWRNALSDERKGDFVMTVVAIDGKPGSVPTPSRPNTVTSAEAVHLLGAPSESLGLVADQAGHVRLVVSGKPNDQLVGLVRTALASPGPLALIRSEGR